MSYLADDAAMRTHFDGQGGMITRDEVPVQEREADDGYDRLVQAIRTRSFDTLLELAREGLTASDVEDAEHDAGATTGLDSELKSLVDLVGWVGCQTDAALWCDSGSGRIEGTGGYCAEGSAI